VWGSDSHIGVQVGTERVPVMVLLSTVGHRPSRDRWARWSAIGVLLAVVTFAAYVLDLFVVSGGVVFVPGGAALVGIGAATVVGYVRGGPLVAWLVSFASLLGFRAYHAFPGLSYRTFQEQLAYFLELEGLFVYAVEGLAIGVLPFLVGSLVRWGNELALVETDTPATER